MTSTKKYTKEERDQIKDVINHFEEFVTRRPNKAKVHFYTSIPYLDIPDNGFSQNALYKLGHYVTGHLDQFNDLQRGDVVIIPEVYGFTDGPENECQGLFIFNGTKLRDLTMDEDSVKIQHEEEYLEYLTDYNVRLIPTEFKVPDQFPIRYWDHIITHNQYVPFEPDKWISQLEHNFTIRPFEITDEPTDYTDPIGNYKFVLSYSWFIDHDQTYYLLYDDIDTQQTKQQKNEPFTPMEWKTYLDELNACKTDTGMAYLAYYEEGNDQCQETFCQLLNTDLDHILRIR